MARAKIEGSNASARSAPANFDGTALGALRDTETALVTLARDVDTERLQAAATADAATAYANACVYTPAGSASSTAC